MNCLTLVCPALHTGRATNVAEWGAGEVVLAVFIGLAFHTGEGVFVAHRGFWKGPAVEPAT